MSDEIKTAEARGYAKGYNAGRKRRQHESIERQRRAKDNALWQRLFVSSLPAAMQAEGWSRGDKPISSMQDRVKLAREWADAAFSEAKREGRA